MAGGMIHHVRILETRPIGTTIRRWREIRHGTMRVMGTHWHQEMLPDHFKPNAQNVYHFQRRSKAHIERKAKGAVRGRDGNRRVDPRAGTDFLTFTGRLREQVLQVATIRTFETRFKLTMPGTPYTPSRPRNPNQPPIAQEVTKILEREKAELAKLGKAYATAELNRPVQSQVSDIR
jgi:hypothetical protein